LELLQSAGVAFRPGFRGLETSGSPQPAISRSHHWKICSMQMWTQHLATEVLQTCLDVLGRSFLRSWPGGPQVRGPDTDAAFMLWNSFPWRLGSVWSNLSDQSTSISGNCKHLLHYTWTRKWRIPCEEALRHGAGFNRIGIRGKCNGEIRQMQRFEWGVCWYRYRL
jgi:hypothetical protein